MKYAIRSLFKYSLIEINRIILVGEQPKFLNYDSDKLVSLRYKETQAKEVNIWEKVLEACKLEDLTEEFLFTNDDYFLLKPVDLSSLPHYHKGDWLSFPWAGKKDYQISGSYNRKANRTFKLLKRLGLTTWHFDIHVPNVYNKKWFKAAYDYFKPFLYQNDGLIISSCYGNYNKLEPTYMPDVKLSRSQLPAFFENYTDYFVFSIFDDAQCPELLEFLQEQFPEKSPVEL